MARRPARRARPRVTDRWQRLPESGRAERYIPPRGFRLPRGVKSRVIYIDGKRVRTVSRRQMENARARRKLGVPWSKFQRRNFDRRYTTMRDRYMRYGGPDRRRLPPEEFAALARPDHPFNLKYYRVNWDDLDAYGSQADFLTYVGLRRPTTMIPVGSGNTGFGEFKR